MTPRTTRVTRCPSPATDRVMLTRILAGGLIGGIVGGIVVGAIESVTTTPLILHAEQFEVKDVASAAQIRSFLGSLEAPGVKKTDLSAAKPRSIKESLPDLEACLNSQDVEVAVEPAQLNGTLEDLSHIADHG